MRRATVHDDSSLAWGFNERSNERMGLPWGVGFSGLAVGRK
jgi:hypothetical protein